MPDQPLSSRSTPRFGRCPTCGGRTENDPYSCQDCIDSIPVPPGIEEDEFREQNRDLEDWDV